MTGLLRTYQVKIIELVFGRLERHVAYFHLAYTLLLAFRWYRRVVQWHPNLKQTRVSNVIDYKMVSML